MYTDQMNCCALNEISHLADHRTPSLAMKAFCTMNTTRYGTPEERKKLYTLGAFYFFSGVTKFRKGTEDSIGHSAKNLTYAQNFAKFIEENNLGTVVELPARRNRLNNPGHTIKPYCWTPSQRAVQAWWEKNRTTRAKKTV